MRRRRRKRKDKKLMVNGLLHLKQTGWIKYETNKKLQGRGSERQARAHRAVPVEHQTLEVLEEQVFVLVQESLHRIPEGDRRGRRVRMRGLGWRG